MSEAHQTLTDEDKRDALSTLMKEGGETPEQQKRSPNVLGATLEFQKAEICLRKNDLAQAEMLAKRAAQIDPQQADYIALARVARGAQAQTAQTPEATQEPSQTLDRAIKMNERCERAYFYRAMLYKRHNREGSRSRISRKSRELNPKNIDAQRELRLYEMRGGPPRRITPYPSQPPPRSRGSSKNSSRNRPQVAEENFFFAPRGKVRDDGGFDGFHDLADGAFAEAVVFDARAAAEGAGESSRRRPRRIRGRRSGRRFRRCGPCSTEARRGARTLRLRRRRAGACG